MDLKKCRLGNYLWENEKCENEWILPGGSLKMGDGVGLENTEEGTKQNRTKMKVKQ